MHLTQQLAQLIVQRLLVRQQRRLERRATRRVGLAVVGRDTLADGIQPPGQDQQRGALQRRGHPGFRGILANGLGGIKQHLHQFGKTQHHQRHVVVAVQIRVQDQVGLVAYGGDQGARVGDGGFERNGQRLPRAGRSAKTVHKGLAVGLSREHLVLQGALGRQPVPRRCDVCLVQAGCTNLRALV